jgi:hypothetical protein
MIHCAERKSAKKIWKAMQQLFLEPAAATQ